MFIPLILSTFLFINTYCSFKDSFLNYTWEPIKTFFTTKKIKDVIIKNYVLDSKFADNYVLNLTNVSGDITIKAWNQNQLSIEVTKLGSEEEVKNSSINVKIDKNNINIDTEKADANKKLANIDYLVMVPEASNLNINLVNGQVAIKYVSGKVNAYITNGCLKLSDSVNSVTAKVVNGNIKVKQKKFSNKNSIFLEIVNGAIDLSLPRNIEGVLSAKTMLGTITSSMPINFTANNKQLNKESWNFLQKNISGFFNNGTSQAPITLETVNGAINIRELK